MINLCAECRNYTGNINSKQTRCCSLTDNIFQLMWSKGMPSLILHIQIQFIRCGNSSENLFSPLLSLFLFFCSSFNVAFSVTQTI
jgi:hypothetical protein